MGILKTIWFLITGVDKQVKSLHKDIREIDRAMSLLVPTLQSVADHLQNIYEVLAEIQSDLQVSPAVAVEVILSGDIKLGENEMLQVATNGSVLATLVAQDAAGNSGAKLDSAPVWTLSDPALGTVNAAEDGLTAVVVLSGKIGKFTLKATALAGGAELSDDSDEVEVVVGAAALLRVDLGV